MDTYLDILSEVHTSEKAGKLFFPWLNLVFNIWMHVFNILLIFHTIALLGFMINEPTAKS